VVSADGTVYEIRNRVALCRCGRPANKPFCQGSHARRSAGINVIQMRGRPASVTVEVDGQQTGFKKRNGQ